MEPKGGELLEQVWEQMKTGLQKCERCGLCRTRTQAVWGVGNPRTKVLLIGEAPGKNEDEQGEPFVGRSEHCLMPPAGKPRPSAGGSGGLSGLSAGANQNSGPEN